MVEKKALEAVKFLEQILKKNELQISKIILFYSMATGKATKDSDIDLVIVSDDFKNKNIFERTELTKEAEIATIKKFMIPLDIITLSKEEFESKTSLISDYAKDGQVILEAA